MDLLGAETGKAKPKQQFQLQICMESAEDPRGVKVEQMRIA